MKKIHILFAPQSLGQHNAWSKAPRDVTAILKRNGYETLRIMTSDKFPFIVKQLYNLWKNIFGLSEDKIWKYLFHSISI